MKHKAILWSVVLVCLIVSLAAGARPAAADALSSSISNLTCTSVTVSGVTSSFGSGLALTITLFNLNSNTQIGFSQGPIGISQFYSQSFSISAAPGDTIRADVADNVNSNTSQATVAPGCVAVGSGSGGFNPGDGRIRGSSLGSDYPVLQHTYDRATREYRRLLWRSGRQHGRVPDANQLCRSRGSGRQRHYPVS